jgi:hypothetical protein
MVLNPPEPHSLDNSPTLYKYLKEHIPEGGHLDMPMLAKGYPEWYPNSPHSHWMYNLQCHIREKATTGEYDATPPCMPSSMDLDP